MIKILLKIIVTKKLVLTFFISIFSYGLYTILSTLPVKYYTCQFARIRVLTTRLKQNLIKYNNENLRSRFVRKRIAAL